MSEDVDSQAGLTRRRTAGGPKDSLILCGMRGIFVPNAFSPRLDILPSSQRRLWDELADVPPEFVLYGGTAIALHLGHRQSVDFDFFGDRPFEASSLALGIGFLADAVVTQRAPNTLGCVVVRGGPVRLSFFGVPGLVRLRPSLVATDNGYGSPRCSTLRGRKRRWCRFGPRRKIISISTRC